MIRRMLCALLAASLGAGMDGDRAAQKDPVIADTSRVIGFMGGWTATRFARVTLGKEDRRYVCYVAQSRDTCLVYEYDRNWGSTSNSAFGVRKADGRWHFSNTGIDGRLYEMAGGEWAHQRFTDVAIMAAAQNPHGSS